MSKTDYLINGSTSINLKHLSSGVCFFEIKVGSEKEIHKAIKI